MAFLNRRLSTTSVALPALVDVPLDGGTYKRTLMIEPIEDPVPSDRQ